ncbi:unnamed protein product, partial [Brassica rapa subsp. narinosa]
MAPVLQVLDLWLVGFGDWFPASLRLAVRFFLTAAMGAPKDIITSVAKNRLFLDHRKGFVFFGVKSSSMLLSSSYIFGLESLDRYAPRDSRCIQGVWTEQRFPLSRYEASGSWSYRLACEAATIKCGWVRKWRLSGDLMFISRVIPVWIQVARVWVLVAAFYGLLVMGIFRFGVNFCMNFGISIMNEFQLDGKKKRKGV